MSKIFTFKKIYKAYLDCRKTKRKTINALKFEYCFEKNIFLLMEELKNKTYKPGRSVCFVVKKPSPREIFAANFKDRVVHHILVREIEDIGEKSLIFDTFSCRKGKGTHFAIKRLKNFIKKATENHTKEAFYIQMDISGFFMAIDHNILYSIFEKIILKQKKTQIWKDDILWLAKTIIFSKPTENYLIKGQRSLFNILPKRKSLFYSNGNKGLPIGNYSSQFFANLYLNKLDQFIKRELKYKYYARYVDDFILIGKDKNKLVEAENKVSYFLKTELGMSLNPNKTKLKSLDNGIEFLGYFIKPLCILAKQKVVKRAKEKIYKLNQLKNLNIDKVVSVLNSYYGHFNHAYTFNLRKSIFENCVGGGLKGKILASADYKKIILKKINA